MLGETGTVTPAPASDIRLIAIDLDGTLLDPDKRLDPDFPVLLAALHARGITVVPASGRQWESIRRTVVPGDSEDDRALLRALDVIAENGALLAQGEDVIAIDPIASPALDAALAGTARYEEAGGDIGVVLCGRRSAYTNRTDERFRTATAPYYPLLETVADLRDIDDDVLKIALWEPSGAEHGILPALGDIPQARLVPSARVGLDIMSPTADKGHALGLLQEKLGISPEQTMVFGDYPNDIGMLRRATWSYAMADAHPDAAAAARHRAPGNHEQGVTRTIRDVLGL